MNATPASPQRVSNAAGLRLMLNGKGSIQRIDAAGVMVNLFPGNEVEGGPANLWLRRQGNGQVHVVPLLGPSSPLKFVVEPDSMRASGQWQGLAIHLCLQLAPDQATWFWHVGLHNGSGAAQTVDLTLVQDIGLSSHGAIRLNEYYVSHYLDLSPLQHPSHGCVLAARQNLAVDGRHPWAIAGSLRRGVAFATDGLQVQGLALRNGQMPDGIALGLPGTRLQHEHALLAIQDEALTLAPGARADLGFFCHVIEHHPLATSAEDLARVDALLALPQAQPPGHLIDVATPSAVPLSLFASTNLLCSLDFTQAELDTLFGPDRRHAEHHDGQLLSFWCGQHRHVALRAKELRVQRPHGHLLRTGSHLVPDETALTSTVWMGGVFHSMVTQGHVSINRFLSTQRSWLSLFRSHGQRILVDFGAGWQQLGLPSAFEIDTAACRWLYRHAAGLLEVRSAAVDAPHAMDLAVRVLEGEPVRLLVSHHVALGGDDGADTTALPLLVDAQGVMVCIPPDSDLAKRFPGGGFRIDAADGSRFAQVGDDGLLYPDGVSRGQPFVCVTSDAVSEFSLRITGHLLEPAAVLGGTLTSPHWNAPTLSPLAADAVLLGQIMPWYLHNAMVHYLAPRGLEQFSGGGWGTRDVCQGPLEMLLALDQTAPVRDLLLRVFEAQNPDGDWPQWFSFFERERQIRAGDSHGDIVFWPLLATAQYLLASQDAALLDMALPFYNADPDCTEISTVWQHIERALAVIATRQIAGTHLAAYGHGDWNDSLQPADPALREHLCSTWTVTLHHQMLRTLSKALRQIGRTADAALLETQAAQVQADFTRLLMVDGVVTGYALFENGRASQLLLHPLDAVTGVHYSLLPMMHAILDDMLSPEAASAHLQLMQTVLQGPDGARLFDAPMPYCGGPQTLFQRAESSAFFGREIGVMYTHAHLRYAQMLAHLGQADAFFEALAKAHPLGLAAHVPSANLRQANCYFSSSDAAFTDRYQASERYAEVAHGTVPLDGGWRVYSSGPGIAIGLIVGSFLGIRRQRSTLIIDPVIPAALDGLTSSVTIGGHVVKLRYQVGPQGHGPLRLELNGTDLPFTRGDNPYRLGAAEVPMAQFLAGLRDLDDRLIVSLS